MTATWQVLVGDALEQLRALPDESVQACITSPPYYGLRDYGVDGQIGLEESPEEFIDALVAVFAEVRRVLRSDGTLWVNLGDSYNARQRGSDAGWDKSRLSNPARIQKAQAASLRPRPRRAGSKAKDLLGMPWTLALALRDDGWWLREEVIWHKLTPMPESVSDRCTRSHEQVFRLTKSPRYFADQDAIRKPLAAKTLTTFGSLRVPNGGGALVKADNWGRGVQERKPRLGPDGEPAGANRRSVWTVEDEYSVWGRLFERVDAAGLPWLQAQLDAWLRDRGEPGSVWPLASQPFREAHFATFPPALVEPMVLASTSPTACGVCGAPWSRRVEVDGEPKTRDRPALLEGATQVPGASPDLRRHGGHHGDSTRPRHTVGWDPTCDHEDASARCVVLDPFSGAATTGLVALRHGRSYVGIELSVEYAEMSRQRILADAPLLNAYAELVA